jgi:hypothetical protein
MRLFGHVDFSYPWPDADFAEVFFNDDRSDQLVRSPR